MPGPLQWLALRQNGSRPSVVKLIIPNLPTCERTHLYAYARREQHCFVAPSCEVGAASRSGWQFVSTRSFSRLLILHHRKQLGAMTAKDSCRKVAQADKDVLVGAKLPLEVSNAVDAWAKRHGHTRASAIRLFIEMGLKRKG